MNIPFPSFLQRIINFFLENHHGFNYTYINLVHSYLPIQQQQAKCPQKVKGILFITTQHIRNYKQTPNIPLVAQ